MSEPQFVDRSDPEAAFTALSDATRIAILQALWDADGAATFSELREAVGMRDSGQFNYHLDKLVGRFVTKTADGYELAQAGMQINGAIEAGAYTASASIEPIALEEPCSTCGGRRTLRYEDDTVSVECESCSATAEFGVPPSVFADCDREEIPDVAGRYMRTTFQRIQDGFCPFCDGPVRPTVAPVSERIESTADVPEKVAERVDELPSIRYDCRRCEATPSGGLGLALLGHPAVVSFYYDRGIDVRERSIWSFPIFDPDRERIRSRDPLRASVTYGADGETLTVVVDEDLEVVEIDASSEG